VQRIEQIAISTRDPLLLMGPTGSVKSLHARRIYELKERAGQSRGLLWM
jgi:transcriptional regulatory protein RtcR